MSIPFAPDKGGLLKAVKGDAGLRPARQWVGAAGVLGLALVVVLGMRPYSWSMRAHAQPRTFQSAAPASKPKTQPAAPASKFATPAAPTHDHFVIMAAPQIDPKMVMAAPQGIDEAMVVKSRANGSSAELNIGDANRILVPLQGNLARPAPPYGAAPGDPGAGQPR